MINETFTVFLKINTNANISNSISDIINECVTQYH